MPTPPRRRWYQFRLRTLLIVVAILAIPLAWIAKERRQSAYEEHVAEQLERQGVSSSFSDPFDSIDSCWAVESKSWWRELAGQILGERLLIVFVQVERRPAVDLTQFAKMSNLQQLEIATDRDSDLTPIVEIPNLRTLVLVGYVCDLSPLTGCNRLEELYFNWSFFSDLTPLSRLTNLKRLYIDGGEISDLTPLIGLRKLTYLRLSVERYTTNQIEVLQKALPDCEIELF